MREIPTAAGQIKISCATSDTYNRTKPANVNWTPRRGRRNREKSPGRSLLGRRVAHVVELWLLGLWMVSDCGIAPFSLRLYSRGVVPFLTPPGMKGFHRGASPKERRWRRERASRELVKWALNGTSRSWGHRSRFARRPPQRSILVMMLKTLSLLWSV